MKAVLRLTRAHSMDVLSSQANIAGYNSVMVVANTYQRFMRMLMTAARTVKAVRVLIMGGGAAGPAGDRHRQVSRSSDRGVRRARAGRGTGRMWPECRDDFIFGVLVIIPIGGADMPVGANLG